MTQIQLLTYTVFWVILGVMAIFVYVSVHSWCRRQIPRENSIRLHKIEKMRSSIDRRSGVDRRKAHDADYLLNGGIRRRSGRERRSQVERRKDWIKVSEWHSVSLNLIQQPLAIKET